VRCCSTAFERSMRFDRCLRLQLSTIMISQTSALAGGSWKAKSQNKKACAASAAMTLRGRQCKAGTRASPSRSPTAGIIRHSSSWRWKFCRSAEVPMTDYEQSHDRQRMSAPCTFARNVRALVVAAWRRCVRW